MSPRFLLFPTAGPDRTVAAWRWIRSEYPDADIEVVVPDPSEGLTSVSIPDEAALHGRDWQPSELRLTDAFRGGRALRRKPTRGTLHLYPDVGGRGCLAADLAVFGTRSSKKFLDDGRCRSFGTGAFFLALVRRSILHRAILACELAFAVATECLCLAALPLAWGLGRILGPLRRRRTTCRVTFLTFYPKSAAGARYRAHNWADRFREDPTIQARVLEPASSHFHQKTFARDTPEGRFVYTVAVFFRRLWHLARVAADDVVVLRLGALPYHPYGGPRLEALLRALGPRFVYDTDDAIHLYYHPPKTTNPILRLFYRCLHTPDRVARIIAMSDEVIVGNPTLAAFARAHSKGRVHVVPTCIDIDRYPMRPMRTGAPLTVGWVGTPWNLRHLDVAAPALARVAEQHDFRLLVVSSAFRALPGVHVENRKWTLAREVADILDMDIGLMPLEPGEEPEAKCGFKALQYMACGIPALVSPIGVNAAIVTPGKNGWHASSDEEWDRSLRSALSDPATREALGQAARRTVEERFTFLVHEPRMRGILLGEEVADFIF